MPQYGEIVQIDPHVPQEVDGYDREWRCGCGAGGVPTAAQLDQFIDGYELMRTHVDEQVAKIVPRLAPEQFATALRAGASDSQHVAGVELLIAHGHWMGYGYLRHYVEGGWNTRTGELSLRVLWGAIPLDTGELWAVARTLENYDDDGRDLATLVRNLIDKRATERGPDRGIMGSSSEIAVLRVAASLVGHGPINLGDDLANLDNTNRGLVVTGLSHMLTHGGGVAFRSARTWPAYHNGTALDDLLAQVRQAWQKNHRRRLMAGADPLDETPLKQFETTLAAVREMILAQLGGAA